MDKVYLWLVLLVILTGCEASAETEILAVSIARRGESLTATVSSPVAVPDPIVLPATDSSANSVDKDASVVLVDYGIEVCEVVTNPQFEREVITLVNAERDEPLMDLIEHAILTQIARQHSQAMACLDFFSHDDPNLGSAEDRLVASGYEFLAIGENIALGYQTPEEVAAAWLSSAGHRENLLALSFKHVGIGYAKLAGENQPAYWTILLTAPQKP